MGLRSQVSGLWSVSGFTFIELVFITLILGILMIAALPRMQRGWSRLHTERAAFAMAQSLRTARALAIAQGSPVQWQWDDEARTIRLSAQQPDGSFAQVPGRLGHLIIRTNDVPITVLQDNESVDTVTLLPDGTSVSTSVLLGDPAEPQFTITLDGPTSHVAVR